MASRIISAKKRTHQSKLGLMALWLILPSAVILAIVDVWPMISGILLSFRGGTLLQPGSFIGLQNFIQLFSDTQFWISLKFTMIFTITAVFGSYFVGLPLALLLRNEVWGRGVFRVLLLLPWVLPPVVSILSWNWILGNQSGLFNQMISWFGGSPQYLLSYPTTAVVAVCIVKVWISYPFMFMTCMAALEGVDPMLYEAASIDGASKFQQFLYITVPQIKGVSVVAWVLMAIWSVNDFATPWLFTQGGPLNATEHLPILAYRDAFVNQNIGQGAAVAVVSLLILLGLSSILLRSMYRNLRN